MNKNLIIIPTYNERDNIVDIIHTVFKITKGLNCHILVIDDNSPDCTYELVETLREKEYKKSLFTIKREGKLGLGTAYIAGFHWGLERKYDVFIEMDADFSHNPKYLPAMIEEMNHVDFVIGSRNIPGGGVVGWGLYRKFLSRGGSFYAKTILGCPINDLTGGFNLWSKKSLLDIGIDNIISEGYSFQIEMKYRAFKKGLQFKEFPIIFQDRTIGVSKMSKKIMMEAMTAVWKLRFGK
jgi:dolichol-phosphate mannosyltransferase